VTDSPPRVSGRRSFRYCEDGAWEVRLTEGQEPRSYGVRLVRGPFVRLAAHPRACSDEQGLLALAADLRDQDPDVRLAADLFCGAGGLSLGFERAGLQVVAAIDHDAEAVETHRHHFPGLSVDWDLADPLNIDRLIALLGSVQVDVIAGGPPCQPFSRAGRSMIRHMVRNGLRDPHDMRRDLWRAFLEVVQGVQPSAVVMENVPDMALDREMFILRTMVEQLEQLGYAVEERLVDTWRYGVPQVRQRLILVALRHGVQFEWPPECEDRVTVWNAIGDLPPVDGGWRPSGGAEGWSDYQEPLTNFQRKMRSGIDSKDSSKVFDHVTRPVREDDASAFRLMDSGTRYSDLPAEFKRYRDDIFDDKYKRLSEDDLSRTITAHIAKDGYWYIHPRQDRTLTVREAARLQTFPDYYRFAGPPSAAFRQIGNAVPPFFAEAIGRQVIEALDNPTKAGVSSTETASILSSWFQSAELRSMPWLRAESRWQVVAAELLLDRASPDQVRFVWPLLRRWVTPEQTAGCEEELREIGDWLGKSRRVAQILEVVDYLAEHPGTLETDSLKRPAGLHQSVMDMAILAVPIADDEASEEPVLVGKGVLRLVARYDGSDADRRNRLTQGRMGIARMVGGGATGRDALKALLELASSICRPVDPKCTECPLAASCRSSLADGQQAGRLF
jgi:DNA (cytosine-5)-methyltransferase 1